MNQNPLSANRFDAGAPAFTAVSEDELMLVAGGGIVSFLKGVANAIGDAVDWVDDHLPGVIDALRMLLCPHRGPTF